MVESALLTQELRKLRNNRGMRQKDVAEALDWSVSKLIRIENGTVGPSKTDLEALLREYRVIDNDLIAELITRARAARGPAWWDRYKPMADKAFEAYIGFEAGASSIRTFQGLLIPGLLQTESYARSLAATYVSPDRIDAVVELRLHRQKEVFARKPEQIHIVDEAAIYRRVGDAMLEQLRHLAQLAERPEVSILVIPFAAGLHFGLKGPFALLSFELGRLDDVLYLESARRGDLLVTNPGMFSGAVSATVYDAADEIASFEDGFQSLWRVALSPGDSLELIRRATEETS